MPCTGPAVLLQEGTGGDGDVGTVLAEREATWGDIGGRGGGDNPSEPTSPRPARHCRRWRRDSRRCWTAGDPLAEHAPPGRRSNPVRGVWGRPVASGGLPFA